MLYAQGSSFFPPTVHVFNPVFFGSSSFGSLLQVTLSSLSEQRAMALQQRALGLFSDTQSSFVDGLINVYQLHSLDPATLRLHVVRLQALNCYKEVSASFAKVKLMMKHFFCFDLHFVSFTGSSAQHEAAVTERTEYGGGETTCSCLWNHK